MTIKPLHDYVVVEAKEKQVSKVIHVAGDNTSDTGVVVAVGPGELLPDGSRGDMSVKAGDEVIFAKDILREDKQDDGSVHYWMRIVNVMGILREQ
tara:strand:+ start:2837 stop:3121 length:285 start_codon:yes stop_codon:yes gene_type:complete